MLDIFVACMREQMERDGFGEKRTKAIVERFTGLAEMYRMQGAGDPETLAMTRAFSELAQERADKAKRSMSDLLKTLDREDAFAAANAKAVSPKNIVSKDPTLALPSRTAISFLERDQRFTNQNYTTLHDVVRGQLLSSMGDILEKITKGTLGIQRGTAHLPNIVREAFGQDTGDAVAKQLAAAWRKTTDLGVDLFNQAGGLLRKNADWVLPQAQNAAKLIRAGKDEWTKFHLDGLDWTKTLWPSGEPIKPEQRQGFLGAVFDTLSTNGANKIDPDAFRGQGSAMGNQLDSHRLLYFKDAETWLKMHESYGDGSVFDVMMHHLDGMAHQTAMVSLFGTNPEIGLAHLRALAIKDAVEKGGGKLLADTEAELKNKFDKMAITISRRNPMAADSILGNAVISTSNVLTSAQLGSAMFMAMAGDWATTFAVRAAEGMNPFAPLGRYLDAFLFDKAHAATLALQSGFVHDGMAAATYSTQRFTGLATVAPGVSRTIADTTLRASGMSHHTDALRWANQSEFMGFLSRSAETKFEDLPFAPILQRYGIDAAAWDAFRKVPAFEQAKGVPMLRPIDILKSDLGNKQELYQRFQGMILDESKLFVPAGTVEGSVSLKDTTRPDTLAGAVLHSFAMYKNFPVSMMQTYSRLAMANPDRGGRLAFIAGMGAAMTISGALGVQMKELSKGRDPLPMNTPAFWGKSLLSGGAFSIWGDFMFGHINQFGRSPAETLAGPLAGFAGDTTQLLLGDTFKFVDGLGGLQTGEHQMKLPAKAVEYLKRYTPGSSLWYARLALERNVWDRLTELADPKAYSNQQARVRKQLKEHGNSYYFAPGERTPGRAPDFSGVLGR